MPPNNLKMDDRTLLPNTAVALVERVLFTSSKESVVATGVVAKTILPKAKIIHGVNTTPTPITTTTGNVDSMSSSSDGAVPKLAENDVIESGGIRKEGGIVMIRKSSDDTASSSVVANNDAVSDKTKSPGGSRRVNFPADDMLVTGYLDAPNPWEKGLNTTPDELVAAYKEACERHNIKPLPRVLQQLQGLVLFGGDRQDCLSLKGERLDLKHYDAMEEIFKRVRFKTIDVESTNLDDEGSVALFDMIEYYESTETLNISSNKNMSTRGWQACARMLKKTHCLEALDAHNTGLNEQFMSLLCRTLRSGSYLTRLHLESCNLSGRACTVLMTALKLNSSLRELYLAENKLSSTDALQIGNLLRANTKLQLIDLRNNHIQDTGVAHIVDGLNDQSMGPGEGLQTLVLWSNQLTFNSSNHLSKALVSSKSLKALNIGCNNITNEGVCLLKDALMKNRTLQQLGLQASRITCEGAIALAEYIADNPCVQQIDLRENNIKVAGLLALSLSMKVNRSVTRLDLDKDPKKESKELQDQHQRLLLEIIEYCERNHQEAEEARLAEEKRRKQMEMEEPEEKLSESVCRLLSLWDPAPPSPKSGGETWTSCTPEEIKNAGCTPGRPLPHSSPLRMVPHEGSYIQHLNSSDSQPSTPIIVLPEGEASARPPVSIGLLPRAALRSVNPCLLSPPAGCPSPPKSRFRVCRVVMDTSDTLLSSAGSTPMPSPVPSPGNTPLPSPGCTPLPSPGCTPLPSPTASPIGSPVSSPLRVMTPNSIPKSVCSPMSSTKSIIKSGAYVISNDGKCQTQKPMFIVSTVSVLPVGLNKPTCSKDTAAMTTTSVSPCLLPSPTLSAVTNGSCAPPSSPAGSEMMSITSTPTESVIRSLGSPSDLISLHSPVSTSTPSTSSHPTPPTAFTFPETESALPQPGWDAPPNTPAETASSISDFSDTPSLTVTDDLALSSRSLTSSSSSSGSLTVSGYKSSSPASVPWTPSPVESETEVKPSVHLSKLSPTSESTLSPGSYPSAISTVSPSDVSPSLDTTSLSKSDWSTQETSICSPANEPVNMSPSSASTNNEDHSWNNVTDWNWRTKDLSACVISGRFSVGVSCSNSMVSSDSGVATPGSELSTGRDQARNDAGVATTRSNAPKVNPPSCFGVGLGSVAPPSSPADSPFSQNCGTGMMAPPSSPIDPTAGLSNSLASSSGNSPVSNAKENVDFSTCPTRGKTKDASVKSRIKRDKYEESCSSSKNVPDIKISAPKSLPIQGNLRPLSPNQNEKKQIVSPSTGVISPARSPTSPRSPTSHRRKPKDSGKSPDSANSLSPTNSGRSRQIRLAEPSCVLLFGGGIPKSNSPSKEGSIDLSATPPTSPDSPHKTSNPQLSDVVRSELARSVATVEATCASLGKLLQESLTAELKSSNFNESNPSVISAGSDLEKAEDDAISRSGPPAHNGDKPIPSSSVAISRDRNLITDAPAVDVSNPPAIVKPNTSSTENNSAATPFPTSSHPMSDENGNVSVIRRGSKTSPEDTLATYEPVLQLVGVQQSRRPQLRKTYSEQDSKGLVRRKSTGSYPDPGRSKDRKSIVRQATLTLDALIEKQLVELNLSLRNTTNAKVQDSSERPYQSLPCDALGTTSSVDNSNSASANKLQPVNTIPSSNRSRDLWAVREQQDQPSRSPVMSEPAVSTREEHVSSRTSGQQPNSSLLHSHQQLRGGSPAFPKNAKRGSFTRSFDESDSECCEGRKLDTYKPSGLDIYKDTVFLPGRESYSSVLKRSISTPERQTVPDDPSIVVPVECSSTNLSSRVNAVCSSPDPPSDPATVRSAAHQTQAVPSSCTLESSGVVVKLASSCDVTLLHDSSRSDLVPKATERLLQSDSTPSSAKTVKSDTVSSVCNVVLRRGPQTIHKASLEQKFTDATDSVTHDAKSCDKLGNAQPERVNEGTANPVHFNHNEVGSVSASVIRQRLVGNSAPADQSTVFCSNGVRLDNKDSFCGPPVTSPCGSNGLNLNLCFLSEELSSSQARLDSADLNLTLSSQEANSPETLTT